MVLNPEFIMENQMIYFIEQKNGEILKFLGLNSLTDFLDTLEEDTEFNLYIPGSVARIHKRDIRPSKKLFTDEKYKEEYHRPYKF